MSDRSRDSMIDSLERLEAFLHVEVIFLFDQFTQPASSAELMQGYW